MEYYSSYEFSEVSMKIDNFLQSQVKKLTRYESCDFNLL